MIHCCVLSLLSWKMFYDTLLCVVTVKLKDVLWYTVVCCHCLAKRCFMIESDQNLKWVFGSLNLTGKNISISFVDWHFQEGCVYWFYFQEIPVRGEHRQEETRVWSRRLENRNSQGMYTYSSLSPAFAKARGTLNLIRLSVCPSVRLSQLAITFALLQEELSDLACVFFVTRPFRWHHVVTLMVTFDLLQGQIWCWAGDHNSLNLLVCVHIGLIESITTFWKG